MTLIQKDVTFYNCYFANFLFFSVCEIKYIPTNKIKNLVIIYTLN